MYWILAARARLNLSAAGHHNNQESEYELYVMDKKGIIFYDAILRDYILAQHI